MTEADLAALFMERGHVMPSGDGKGGVGRSEPSHGLPKTPSVNSRRLIREGAAFNITSATVKPQKAEPISRGGTPRPGRKSVAFESGSTTERSASSSVGSTPRADPFALPLKALHGNSASSARFRQMLSSRSSTPLVPTPMPGDRSTPEPNGHSNPRASSPGVPLGRMSPAVSVQRAHSALGIVRPASNILEAAYNVTAPARPNSVMARPLVSNQHHTAVVKAVVKQPGTRANLSGVHFGPRIRVKSMRSCKKKYSARQ